MSPPSKSRVAFLSFSGVASLWVLSFCSLGLAMSSNLAAERSAALSPLHKAAPVVVHLHAEAVFFALGCTLLQLASGLLGAFALRAVFRLRSAICYSVGVLSVIMADILALFGLLVWMRLHDPL